jgi:hypothetical protein
VERQAGSTEATEFVSGNAELNQNLTNKLDQITWQQVQRANGDFIRFFLSECEAGRVPEHCSAFLLKLQT